MKMDDSGRKQRLALLIGALGVVYGDIGTSPLYTLRECFTEPHGVPVTPGNVLGVVSLIFWSLVVIVSIKYLSLVMRADNRGEGGILALLTLAAPEGGSQRKPKGRLLIWLGVFGAALLYGDGMITPAVTVLSAVEGLKVATPVFGPYVVPIAVLILIALFRVQRHGTGTVGTVFGPIMCVWFFTLAILGINGIVREPGILLALSPGHGVIFLLSHGHAAFLVLGSVFLSVTGAEALYADMGHFGLRAIRRAWFAIVFPGLLLNYFGEGALLLAKPAAASNPFYFLAPSWAVLPLVILATMAAVIASQALISGAYSLTMQGIQMGFLPRMRILHTSQSERGQIYIPHINNILMVACIGLVLGFGSSSRLAGAYGIAVSMTMLITTVLFFAAARRRWNWKIWQATLVCGIFMIVELAFVSANALKVLQGGWFPLAIAAMVFAAMTTWKKGREILRSKLTDAYLPLNEFLHSMDRSDIHRVPGTAVFLSGNPKGTPVALLHNLKHNKVLHERVLIMTIITEDIPYVEKSERLHIDKIRPDIYRITGHYGFMEQPNVPALLRACKEHKLEFKELQTTFFLSRESIIAGRGREMALWRRRLFSTLSRNAQSATAFFQIPPNRVVELGMQVEM